MRNQVSLVIICIACTLIKGNTFIFERYKGFVRPMRSSLKTLKRKKSYWPQKSVFKSKQHASITCVTINFLLQKKTIYNVLTRIVRCIKLHRGENASPRPFIGLLHRDENASPKAIHWSSPPGWKCQPKAIHWSSMNDKETLIP